MLTPVPMTRDLDPGYLALVSATEGELLRAARLLTGDWAGAETLLRSTLAWALRAWEVLSIDPAARTRLRQRLIATYLVGPGAEPASGAAAPARLPARLPAPNGTAARSLTDILMDPAGRHDTATAGHHNPATAGHHNPATAGRATSPGAENRPDPTGRHTPGDADRTTAGGVARGLFDPPPRDTGAAGHAAAPDAADSRIDPVRHDAGRTAHRGIGGSLFDPPPREAPPDAGHVQRDAIDSAGDPADRDTTRAAGRAAQRDPADTARDPADHDPTRAAGRVPQRDRADNAREPADRDTILDAGRAARRGAGGLFDPPPRDTGREEARDAADNRIDPADRDTTRDVGQAAQRDAAGSASERTATPVAGTAPRERADTRSGWPTGRGEPEAGGQPAPADAAHPRTDPISARSPAEDRRGRSAPGLPGDGEAGGPVHVPPARVAPDDQPARSGAVGNGGARDGVARGADRWRGWRPEPGGPAGGPAYGAGVAAANGGTALVTALSTLDPEQRALVVSRYYLGLSAAEIGEILGDDAEEVTIAAARLRSGLPHPLLG
jgi:hypothetical protein